MTWWLPGLILVGLTLWRRARAQRQRTRLGVLEAYCALHTLNPRLAAKTRFVASLSVPDRLHGAVMEDDTIEIYARTYTRGGPTVLVTALHEWAHFDGEAVDPTHNRGFFLRVRSMLQHAAGTLGVPLRSTATGYRQLEQDAVERFAQVRAPRRRIVWRRGQTTRGRQ